MTQTGYFADFLETLHATQVADTDGNGLNEFIDPWGTPIRLEFFPADPPGDNENQLRSTLIKMGCWIADSIYRSFVRLVLILSYGH